MLRAKLALALTTCTLVFTALSNEGNNPAEQLTSVAMASEAVPEVASVTAAEAIAMLPPVRSAATSVSASAPERVVAAEREQFVPEVDDEATPTRDGERRVLRRICRVTAYCDRGTTASGVQSGVGQCAAPGDIPFGSTIYIPALDKRVRVTDRTHERFRRSTVDIFMPSCDACITFGVHFLEVEIELPRGA